MADTGEASSTDADRATERTDRRRPWGVAGRSWMLRVGVLLGVIGLMGLAVHLGLVGFLQDGDRVEAFLTESGPLGPIAFVSVFTLAQPFSVPGVAMIVPATFVWSGPVVFALSWLGGMIASTIGFSVARWFARDWIQARLTDGMRSWETRLDDHGTRAIILLRLVTGYAPMADWLLGVSTVTIRQFLIGTGIGLVPTTAIAAFYGDDALRIAARLPFVAGGLAIVGALAWLALRRRRAARSGV